ncbi:hypothetical protein L3X38_044338 [Prunus dulcis]|uniref:Uncharacterized protein n=1 Tax=Prunus dulcis TaxID=3755 RepID=A0AAD4V059_PRUDU|nr:hypothetical protein L3X38_044338 [Prunus dulcis]
MEVKRRELGGEEEEEEHAKVKIWKYMFGARIQGNIRNPVFEEVHGEDLWSFCAANPDHSKLFNEAMACDARVVVPAVIESCIC